jgi:GATA-binding protein
MENLTWRMMAMALRKKREEEEDAEKSKKVEEKTSVSVVVDGGEKEGAGKETDEGVVNRGRRPDKGKARMRVVGFGIEGEDPNAAPAEESR